MNTITFLEKLLLVNCLVIFMEFNPAFCDSEIQRNSELRNDKNRKNISPNSDKIKSEKNSLKKLPWIYSSIKLKTLHLQERYNVRHFMTEYEKVLRERLEFVQRYLTDYEESVINPEWPDSEGRKEITIEGENLAYSIASHPLWTYRMIRRFAVEIHEIEKSLDFEKKLLNNLKITRENMKWPTKQDLDTAITAIINTQFTYDIITDQMTSGLQVVNHETKGLSKVQIIEIGNKAVEIGHFALGLEWLEIGREKNNESITDRPFNETLITDFINNATKNHDEEFDSTDTTDLTLFETKVEGLKKFPPKRRSLHLGFNRESLDKVNILHRYNLLCSGKAELFQERISFTNRLRCWLDQISHPYFKLRPLKTELLNYDPYLVIFHEVLSIAEVKHLIDQSAFRAKFKNGVPYEETTMPVTYIDEERKAFRNFQYIEKRIELITGLNVRGRKNSEPLEVAEHTFAARYFFQDPQDKKTIPQNDDGIVANFLMNLKKPDQNGKIAFPIMGIYIDLETRGELGSAIFWYTKYKDGLPDHRSMHAHCPVVFGTKWTALKKIKGRNNVFKRPCSRLISV